MTLFMRYLLPFVVHADHDAVIAPLESCVSNHSPARCQPITCGAQVCIDVASDVLGQSIQFSADCIGILLAEGGATAVAVQDDCRHQQQ